MFPPRDIVESAARPDHRFARCFIPPGYIPGVSAWRNSLYLLVALTALNQVTFIGARLAISLDAARLDASPATIGVLIAIIGLFATLTTLSAGRWVDRVGARGPMLISSAVLAAGVAIAFVWRELAALFLVSALVGLSYNTYYVAQQPLLALYGRPEDRVRNFGLAGLGVTAAGFAAPLVTGVTIDAFGHAYAFLLLALLPLVSCALIATGGIAIPLLAPRPKEAGAHNSMALLGEAELRAIYLFAATGIGVWQMLLFLVPLYGIALGLSASEIGVAMGANALAMAASRAVLAPAVQRLGAWAVLVGSLALAALGLVLLPFATALVSLSLVSGLLGAALGASNPIAQALLYEHAPPGRTTEALTLWSMLASGVQTAIPLASGALGALFGMRAVFWGLAILLVACCYTARHRWRRPSRSKP
jgi:MFS family permease